MAFFGCLYILGGILLIWVSTWSRKKIERFRKGRLYVFLLGEKALKIFYKFFGVALILLGLVLFLGEVLSNFRIEQRQQEKFRNATATSLAMLPQTAEDIVRATAFASVQIRKIQQPNDLMPLEMAVLSQDGTKVILVGNKDADIFDIEVEDNERDSFVARLHIYQGRCGRGKATGLSFIPGRKTVITADNSGRIKSWDTQTWQEDSELFVAFEDKLFENSEEKRQKCDEFPKIRVISSPDGRRIVVGGEFHVAIVWDVVLGEQIALLNHGESIESLAYSPDGQTILTVGNVVRVWNADTGEEFIVFDNDNRPKNIVSAVYSPDGRKIVMANHRHSVATIWDADAWENSFGEISQVGLTYATFSPDGRNIVTTGLNQRAIIWDTKTGKKQATLIHESGVVFAMYSTDGKQLLTMASSGPAVIWDVTALQEGGEFLVDWDQVLR